jgi:hypothetical protein
MVGSLRLSIYLHGQTFEKYFFSKSCHPARIRSHDPQRQVETLPLDLPIGYLKSFIFIFVMSLESLRSLISAKNFFSLKKQYYDAIFNKKAVIWSKNA